MKVIVAIGKAVYAAGALIVIVLVCIALFGSDLPENPDAMIPFTCKESAFLLLCVGAAPMLLVCAAFYGLNDLGQGDHKIRNTCLVFLPGIPCAGCALYVLGLLAWGMIRLRLFG